jgi:hypothetical protein
MFARARIRKHRRALVPAAIMIAPRLRETVFCGMFLGAGAQRAQFAKARVRASQCRKTQAVVKQTNGGISLEWFYRVEPPSEKILFGALLESATRDINRKSTVDDSQRFSDLTQC